MKKLFTFCLALCATTALWANFTPAAFSVAEGKYVYFTKGNLQYTQSTQTWSFAENQYDMLGTDNVTDGTTTFDAQYGYTKVGTALADKIDVFGWSANNVTAPWGLSTSTDNSDYSGDFVDWGKNIGDGWRTLTNKEWEYLLDTRANAQNLKGAARINLIEDGTQFVNGLILLPDNWTEIDGITFKSGFPSEIYKENVADYAAHQTFLISEWQMLEAAGAVFLPSVGSRSGITVDNVQSISRYWSASLNGMSAADCLYFSSSEAGVATSQRRNGLAVRLVQDMYAVNVTEATNGKVESDKTVAAAGETITLTITPETGYEVEKIAVTYGEDQEVAVSADNTFTMPASTVTVTVTFKVASTALQNVEMAEIYAENGTIYGAEGMQIFTITGQNVTEMNGQLNGVYIVKCANKAQKIIVR